MKELREILDDWIDTDFRLREMLEEEAGHLSCYKDGLILMHRKDSQYPWYGTIKGGKFTGIVMESLSASGSVPDHCEIQVASKALVRVNLDCQRLKGRLKGIEHALCQEVITWIRDELRSIKNIHVLYKKYEWHLYTGRAPGSWTTPFLAGTNQDDRVFVDVDEESVIVTHSNRVSPLRIRELEPEQEPEHITIDGERCYPIKIDEFPDLPVYEVPFRKRQCVNIHEVDCEDENSLRYYNALNGNRYGDNLIPVDVYISWRNVYHSADFGVSCRNVCGMIGPVGFTGAPKYYDYYLGVNVYEDSGTGVGLVVVGDLVKNDDDEKSLRSYMNLMGYPRRSDVYPVVDCVAWKLINK